MTWSSTAPLGSVSVKANRTILGNNTTYIENTMGKSVVGTNTNTTRDHFWANVSANLDGRHRFIQSVGFTSTAVAPNDVYPVLGASMQTVFFPLLVKGEVHWHHKNINANTNIFQVTPAVKYGTVVISGSYVIVTDVPTNVYGEIFMYTNLQGKYSTVTGFFRSRASTSIVEAWALANLAHNDSNPSAALKFANDAVATDLNIKARTEEASNGQTWNYIITYRAL